MHQNQEKLHGDHKETDQTAVMILWMVELLGAMPLTMMMYPSYMLYKGKDDNVFAKYVGAKIAQVVKLRIILVLKNLCQ